MGINVLYLDKMNEPMERMILDMCPPDVDLRFLQPNIGKKGTLEEAECLFDTTFQVTREIIDQVPKLKLIQRTGVGVDMVDVAYAKEKNIPVSICRGFNSSSVAELAVLDMLALYRYIVDLTCLSRKKEWHTWTFRHESYELLGKTVGIIGGGAIGREVMKRVSAFGTHLIYNDVVRMDEEKEKELGCEYVSFDELIKRSDIISLHVPLLDSTRGMIGAEQFAQMKDTALLINTARGQLVDEKALVEALKSRKIRGAAVDVFEPEDPLFGLEIDNLITTPHVGAATYDNYYRVYKFGLENAQRVAAGEAPLGCL